MRIQKAVVLASLVLSLALPVAAQPTASSAGQCPYIIPQRGGYAGEPAAISGVSVQGDGTAISYAEWDQLAASVATMCSAWVPTYYGTAPPATCEPPLVFFDTDATAGENLSLCTATNTWTPVAGGGGSALTVEEADGAPTVGSVATIQFDQADGFSVVDETGGQVQVDFALPADSVTAAEMGDADHGQVVWAGGVATVEGLQFGTAFPGSPDTGDVFTVTDDSAVGVCDSAGGTARSLCWWDGASWGPLGDGAAGALGSQALAIVAEEEPSGTHAGNCDGTWQRRQLNTSRHLGIVGASLAGEQLTLPAGSYWLDGWAMGMRAGHQTRIWNATDGVVVALGAAVYQDTGADGEAGNSPVTGYLDIQAAKSIELHTKCSGSTATGYGLGFALNLGDGEVFAKLTALQLGAPEFVAGARASRSTTQAIPNATWTAVTMDAEAWDDGDTFDLATQPTRISVPAGSAGRWLVVGEAEWSATGSATAVQAAIRQTGAEVAAVNAEDFASAGHQVSAVVDAAAGDYFELFVRQDSGVSDDVASAWVAAWCLSCGPGGGGDGGSGAGGDAVLVRVEKNASQSVASGTATVLTWETEIDDADGFRDPGTPNRLVVPSGFDGVYTVGCIATHATTTSVDVAGTIEVTVNGVPEGRGSHRNPIASAGTVSATTAVSLVAGDYVECEFQHDDSAALDVWQCGGNNCTNGAPTQLWMVGR